MKIKITVIVIILLMSTYVTAADKGAISSDKDKLSYSIGLDIGSKLRSQSIDVDPEIVARGLKDGFKGGDTLISEQEANEVMNAFQKKRMAEQEVIRKQLSERNIKEGDLFLAKNKDKKGVKTTASGLQYRVLKKGKGKSPKANDSVTVNYRGTLIDGTEFDSSYKRGQPATFNVSAVIKGWTEALQMMKEGGKWELYIPSKLGYGERGAGRLIGPNSVLIFEVELISVN
ncbi:MAG: FKBP-type peptidyl-prolyl cis-trans isomerase [Nitrospirota bacterium]|nr:MAG: FKBP-type peptidyl-prolyl cis-trans isomerase [Nitrospirota bacterium]